MEGEPEIDLWSVDSRRYGSYATWAYNHEKIADTYPRLYSIFFPNEFRDAARPNRVSPIYEYQKQAGAVFGDYFGWECPNYFTWTETDRYEKPSWRRSNAFNHVAEECRHVMNHVGLLDLTRFAKTRVSGPGADAWLNRLTCQRVPTQDGRIAKQLVGKDSNVDKEYLVRVQGKLDDSGLALLNRGLKLDGEYLKPAKVAWQNEDQLRFVLREGKKRQIRRMCELVGLKVTGLKRIRIGRVKLGNLPVGQWRYLGPEEQF